MKELCDDDGFNLRKQEYEIDEADDHRHRSLPHNALAHSGQRDLEFKAVVALYESTRFIA